jgi:hypothetical protein
MALDNARHRCRAFLRLCLVSQLPRVPAKFDFAWRHIEVRTTTTLIFLSLLFVSTVTAQSVAVQATAEQTIQPSQSSAPDSTTRPPAAELKIPAGTPIEVEVAYTVNSIDVKPGERMSFRVLVPIVIDGMTVIERGALVTARVTQAKRGGHWGRAGKLAWTMEDVVATDNSRIPLAPETVSRGDNPWSLEKKTTKSETTSGQGSVKGTSHAGEVAVMSIVSGALFPPLALMNGFKRGENAILREGRRFVVAVGKESIVRAVAAVATP